MCGSHVLRFPDHVGTIWQMGENRRDAVGMRNDQESVSTTSAPSSELDVSRYSSHLGMNEWDVYSVGVR